MRKIPSWMGFIFILIEMGVFLLAGNALGLLGEFAHMAPASFYTLPIDQ